MLSLVQAMQQPDFNADPVLVLSNVPNAGGLEKANALGIPTQTVDHKRYSDRPSFEVDLAKAIDEQSPDVICLAGFMRILEPEFIFKYQGRMLNIHPSLLPKYKGLNTHQRAIDNGDKVAGCSIHMVTAELDGGRVLAQKEVPILPEDTAETLAARVLIEEHKLYPAALRDFVNG